MSARRLIIAGAALSVLALILIAVAPPDALRAWLAATFLWSGVPIGSLGFLMMIRLIGGRWGFSLSPFFEAGALTLPVAAVAIIPVLVGMAVLYPWVGKSMPGFKGAWLAPLPFVLRTLILYGGLGLALWTLVTRRGSALAISSAGLLFLMPMMTLVAVDWIISLDPIFHSSGFGLYALSIQFTVALMSAVWLLLGREPEQTRTLAALIVTMILLWVYLAFASYFIIWSGDLADVVGWYLVRGAGGWGLVYGLCAVIETVCFLVLLSPRARSSAEVLRGVAAVMILGKLLEAAWLVLPQAGPLRLIPAALYLVAAVGLGLVTIGAQKLLLERRVAERAPQ